MVSYVPPTLADAWQKVVDGTQAPPIVLGNFLDDWHRSTEIDRQRIVAEVIADVLDLEQHRWACFLAATVEYLTVTNELPPPRWVFEDRWVLDEPWFLISYWKLRAWLLVATPPPWKRRRIFGGDETMMIGRV